MTTNNELIISIITISLSSLSLIITVIGWSATARRQKELLERQISAENNRTKLSFSIPRQLQIIDSIREWKSEGDRILSNIKEGIPNDTEKEKLSRTFNQWHKKFYFHGLSDKTILLDEVFQSNLFFFTDNYIMAIIKNASQCLGKY